MFETSVIRVRVAAAPRRIGLLTASIAFHSLVIVGAVVMTLSSVSFPKKAPAEMDLFRPVPPVSLPPALGTPRPPAPRPPAAQQQAPRTTPTLTAVTAPPVVPDTITPAAASTSTPSDASASSSTPGTGEGPIGDPNGVAGGIGTDPGAVAGTGEILHPGGDVKPAIVLQRVSPAYPQVAVKAHMNGTVVIECIIGRDGTCRDPRVLTSTFTAFNQSALDAVQRWRFAPGTLNGRVVDTYFDLTVVFKLN